MQWVVEDCQEYDYHPSYNDLNACQVQGISFFVNRSDIAPKMYLNKSRHCQYTIHFTFIYTLRTYFSMALVLLALVSDDFDIGMHLTGMTDDDHLVR